MRQFPIPPQTVRDSAGEIRRLLPCAAIFDDYANRAVLIEHGRAVLILVVPVLAPVRAGLIPREPRPVLAVDCQRGMRLERRRFRDLLDRAGRRIASNSPVEDVIVPV